MGDRIHEQRSMKPSRCPGRRKNPGSGLYNFFLSKNQEYTTTHGAHTANEGPVRIQYKCLVSIYVFPEMKLLFPKQNNKFLSPTLVEAKMFTFTHESTHFIFNMCPIYTHDGASAKFSTNSHETDYSAVPTLIYL
jgi:hypothetical protein